MRTGFYRKWKRDREIYYFDPEVWSGTVDCARTLHGMIYEAMMEEKKKGVLILCIGTDRSTGDSLGPLIGHKLKGQLGSILVIGTLEQPVHAMNLGQAMEMIEVCYPEHVIVAVDASVGSEENVGCVTLGKGSLRPGLGVRKKLQAVGDVFITGIVGNYGNHDPMMLQSVRLSVVMKIADYISESVFLVEQFLENPVLV